MRWSSMEALLFWRLKRLQQAILIKNSQYEGTTNVYMYILYYSVHVHVVQPVWRCVCINVHVGNVIPQD